MKRENFFIPVLLGVIFLLTGCTGDRNTPETSVNDFNATIATTQDQSANYENQNIKIGAEKDSDGGSTSDLFYRKYQKGTAMSEGTVIIHRDTITDITENPQAIVIFCNDVITEIIPYEENEVEIEYEIKKAGNYAFYVLEENESLTDVSDKTTYFIQKDKSPVILLN